RVVVGVDAPKVAVARILAAAAPALEPGLEHAVHPLHELRPQAPRLFTGQQTVQRLIAPPNLTFGPNAVLQLPGAAILRLQKVDSRPARIGDAGARLLLGHAAVIGERGVEYELEHPALFAHRASGRARAVHRKTLFRQGRHIDAGSFRHVRARNVSVAASQI